MNTNAKERRHYLTAMSKYSPEKPLYTPNCIVRRAVADVDDAVRLLRTTRENYAVRLPPELVLEFDDFLKELSNG